MRLEPAEAALFTDLYELTMAASYFSQGMNGRATFDLTVREHGQRNFLLACGIDEVLRHVCEMRFDGAAIEYLRSLGVFDEAFLAFLRGFRFTGDIDAVAEGEIVLPGTPLLTVTGPLIDAQVIETLLLNAINFETAVATKAARVHLACAGRPWVDFSTRRDHGVDAALKVARAAHIAGAAGTSNVLAGAEYGIPVSGTMAHSYVMAFEAEDEAFRAYARDFPELAVLLIDTYDVVEGARSAAHVASELKREGVSITAVRIDSGDLGEAAQAVRRVLDDADHRELQIFASGDLDEFRIEELVAAGAPIDAFGVGTRLGTVEDAPSLGGVYKLVEYDGRPVAKESAGKATLPGRKQVYRDPDQAQALEDVVGLRHEAFPGMRPLLVEAVRGGRHRHGDALDTVRERVAGALASLPPAARGLHRRADAYRVDISPGLRALARSVRRRA